MIAFFSLLLGVTQPSRTPNLMTDAHQIKTYFSQIERLGIRVRALTEGLIWRRRLLKSVLVHGSGDLWGDGNSLALNDSVVKNADTMTASKWLSWQQLSMTNVLTKQSSNVK